MSNGSYPSPLAICRDFFHAIESCDTERLRQLYTANALIWHNFDDPARVTERPGGQTVDENIALLAALPLLIRDLKYEPWSETETQSGFVRQHFVTGTAADGEGVRIPACVVCTVVGDRIDSLHEFLDTNHLPAVIRNQLAN